MSTLVTQRLAAPGPKKILACDGGGILGLISVEILARLEDELRTRTGPPGLVLADWFDFVCGTSTGAIIAACISAGLSTEQIRRFYLDSGADMFHRASVFKRLKYGYDDEPLAAKLKRELNRALGRIRLRLSCRHIFPSCWLERSNRTRLRAPYPLPAGRRKRNHSRHPAASRD